MEIYHTIVNAIREYLHDENYETLFLAGGCYWFAAKVNHWVPNSYLMINKNKEHCAVMVEHQLCDITGPISKAGYRPVDEKEQRYMQKNYCPKKNLKELGNYIDKRVRDYLTYKRVHYSDRFNCDN